MEKQGRNSNRVRLNFDVKEENETVTIFQVALLTDAICHLISQCANVFSGMLLLSKLVTAKRLLPLVGEVEKFKSTFTNAFEY